MPDIPSNKQFLVSDFVSVTDFVRITMWLREKAAHLYI